MMIQNMASTIDKDRFQIIGSLFPTRSYQTITRITPMWKEMTYGKNLEVSFVYGLFLEYCIRLKMLFSAESVFAW